LQVGAFDFIFELNNVPLRVEASCGFVSKVYNPCTGYWEENLVWYCGKTTKEKWMIDFILKQINEA
jgi:hypothetical protein